jgi:pheromone shutdown protein TraB
MDEYKAAFGEEAEKSMLDVAAIGMELRWVLRRTWTSAPTPRGRGWILKVVVTPTVMMSVRIGVVRKSRRARTTRKAVATSRMQQLK